MGSALGLKAWDHDSNTLTTEPLSDTILILNSQYLPSQDASSHQIWQMTCPGLIVHMIFKLKLSLLWPGQAINILLLIAIFAYYKLLTKIVNSLFSWMVLSISFFQNSRYIVCIYVSSHIKFTLQKILH